VPSGAGKEKSEKRKDIYSGKNKQRLISCTQYSAGKDEDEKE